MPESTIRSGSLVCEVLGGCDRLATYVYGPECEAETGKLMFLCGTHANWIATWAEANPNRPIECPTHGIIGPVKNYLVLKRLPR